MFLKTVEVWVGSALANRPGKEWDEAEKLLWTMMLNADEASNNPQNNRFYSTSKIEANVDSINGAFSLVLRCFARETNSNDNQQFRATSKLV